MYTVSGDPVTINEKTNVQTSDSNMHIAVNPVISDGELGLCAGIFNRSATSVSNCIEILGDFQNFLFPNERGLPRNTITSLNMSPGDESSPIVSTLRLLVSTILAVAASIHILSGFILTLYSATGNNLRLNITHWQVKFSRKWFFKF